MSVILCEPGFRLCKKISCKNLTHEKSEVKSFHPSVVSNVIFSYNLVFTALDVGGISYTLMQHCFPHEQWAMLAVGLKLAVNISKFQDNDNFYRLKNVIDFWVCSDSQRSWEKLLKAIIFCKQKRVAKSLADAMNVSFLGEFADVLKFSILMMLSYSLHRLQ